MASLNKPGALERLGRFLRKAVRPGTEAAAQIPALATPKLLPNGLPYPKVPRILALDMGRRYIGVAVADAASETAVPLTVIDMLLPHIAAKLPKKTNFHDPVLRNRSPLDYKPPSAIADEIRALRDGYNVVSTVIGMPEARTFDDKDFPRFIMEYTARLRTEGAFGSIDPAFDSLYWSEHLSTKQAKQGLAADGIVGYMKQKQAGLDMEAAAIFLDDFLGGLRIAEMLSAGDASDEEAAAARAADRAAAAGARSSRRDYGLPIGRGFSDAEFEEVFCSGRFQVPPELDALGLTDEQIEARVAAHVARNLFFVGAAGQIYAFDTPEPILRAARARLADWQFYAEFLQKEHPRAWAALGAAERSLALKRAMDRRAQTEAEAAARALDLALTPPPTMALVHRTGLRSASALDTASTSENSTGRGSGGRSRHRTTFLPSQVYTPMVESIDFSLAVAAGADPVALAARVRAARNEHDSRVDALTQEARVRAVDELKDKFRRELAGADTGASFSTGARDGDGDGDGDSNSVVGAAVDDLQAAAAGTAAAAAMPAKPKYRNSPALSFLLQLDPHAGSRARSVAGASPATQLGPAGGVDSVLGGVGKGIFSPNAVGERWIEAEEAAASIRARLRAAVADATAQAAAKDRKRAQQQRRRRAAAAEAAAGTGEEQRT